MANEDNTRLVDDSTQMLGKTGNDEPTQTVNNDDSTQMLGKDEPTQILNPGNGDDTVIVKPAGYDTPTQPIFPKPSPDVKPGSSKNGLHGWQVSLWPAASA